MKPKTLVHMANRIGEFFQAMPDREEALLGVATHIRKFWDPRMRRELRVYLISRREKACQSSCCARCRRTARCCCRLIR